MTEVRTTKKQQVLDLLSDLKWHSNDELKDITWRFSAALLTLRDAGYDIDTVHFSGSRYHYRLKSREPGVPSVRQCCPTCGRSYPLHTPR